MVKQKPLDIDIEEGTFTEYVKRNPKFKGKSLLQAAKYIVKNPKEFQEKTRKRAQLAINFSKMRKKK